MLRVDTNIIAPLYVQNARSDAVKELCERDGIWRTEPLALIDPIASVYAARVAGKKRPNVMKHSPQTS